MNNPQDDLDNLKHRLYGALLKKPTEFWTDEEIEIGYALSKDPSIQKTLSQINEATKKKG